MEKYHHIYSSQAAKYDLLVSREDYQGNIGPTLAAIRPSDDLQVVELGAGTGRLTRLLAPRSVSLVATDISTHMLQTARQGLLERALDKWHLAAADNEYLPLASGTADLTLAGWSLGHTLSWYPATWRQKIGRMLSEMRRVTRPGGIIIILETMGTGRETPLPPTAGLAAYYRLLENENGFQASWIRTDYRFASPAEAEELVRFFFGRDLADWVAAKQAVIVPECTGIWWKSC